MFSWVRRVFAWGLLLATAAAFLVSDGNLWAEPNEHRQVVIAVTHQLRGSIAARASDPDQKPGGLAHLAPLIQRLRATSPSLILVDAGGALGGNSSPLSTADSSPPPIIAAMGRLHYDAVALGERTLSLDRHVLALAIQSSSFPWLAANLKGDNLPLHISPTGVIERNGLRIGFIGLAAPGAMIGIPPKIAKENLVGDAESAARKAASDLRDTEHADLVIALGGGGRGGGTSERETAALLGLPLLQAAGRLADAIPELDLIIASRGRTPRKGEIPRPNRSMRVPLIEPATGPRGLTVVRLDVERAEGHWTVANVEQETLWAARERDPDLMALAKAQPTRIRKRLPELAGVYIAGRAPRRQRDACAGALVHAAIIHAAGRPDLAAGANSDNPSRATPLSLLPFQWNWRRYAKGDTGRLVTLRDLRLWIPQDDRIVESTLTGRQIALMLQPYVRSVHGWSASRVQVLYPGGMDVTLGPNRSEAVDLRISGGTDMIDARGTHRVWMTEYHRFGGGGVAPRALVQPDQPYRTAGFSLRGALEGFLARPELPLPAACDRVLTRTAPQARPHHHRDRKRPREASISRSEPSLFACQ